MIYVAQNLHAATHEPERLHAGQPPKKSRSVTLEDRADNIARRAMRAITEHRRIQIRILGGDFRVAAAKVSCAGILLGIYDERARQTDIADDILSGMVSD